MSDPKTIATYDASVGAYSDMLKTDPNGRDRANFLAGLTPGARVLDFGCGPGVDAMHMAKAGFTVEAWDASPEMVAAASAQPGVMARHATFAELEASATYDGIWAAFSLLHARRTELPGRIIAMHKALKPNGKLYIALKLGTGEHRDRLGRFYSYVTEDELTVWLTEAGFSVTATRRGTGKGLAGTEDPFICLFADA